MSVIGFNEKDVIEGGAAIIGFNARDVIEGGAVHAIMWIIYNHVLLYYITV